MPVYLGIDYGEKRIGLSIADDLGLASPLPAAVEPNKKERIRRIESVVRERRITDLVIGHPLNMDGTAGFKAKEAERFAELLRERLQLPVHLVDERLTSHEAENLLKQRRRKISRASGEIDSLAAALILQDFLDRLAPPLEPTPFPEDDDEDEWDD